jgi:hypothetical protein
MIQVEFLTRNLVNQEKKEEAKRIKLSRKQNQITEAYLCTLE